MRIKWKVLNEYLTHYRYNTNPSLCFFNVFLIGGQLLYNVVLIYAIHQHQSAVNIHTSLKSHPPTSYPILPF